MDGVVFDEKHLGGGVVVMVVVGLVGLRSL